MTDFAAQPYSFTVWGAMHYTGLGRSRIYKLVKAGEIASFTIGSRRMFLRADLDAFMDRQATATKTDFVPPSG